MIVPKWEIILMSLELINIYFANRNYGPSPRWIPNYIQIETQWMVFYEGQSPRLFLFVLIPEV